MTEDMLPPTPITAEEAVVIDRLTEAVLNEVAWQSFNLDAIDRYLSWDRSTLNGVPVMVGCLVANDYPTEGHQALEPVFIVVTEVVMDMLTIPEGAEEVLDEGQDEGSPNRDDQPSVREAGDSRPDS